MFETKKKNIQCVKNSNFLWENFRKYVSPSTQVVNYIKLCSFIHKNIFTKIFMITLLVAHNLKLYRKI